MTIRFYLLASASPRYVRAFLPRLTARQMADTMAWSYGLLHLSHLNRPAA